MSMEVASEGDRGTRETPALNFQIVFWRLRRRLGGEFVMNRPGAAWIPVEHLSGCNASRVSCLAQT